MSEKTSALRAGYEGRERPSGSHVTQRYYRAGEIMKRDGVPFPERVLEEPVTGRLHGRWSGDEQDHSITVSTGLSDGMLFIAGYPIAPMRSAQKQYTDIRNLWTDDGQRLGRALEPRRPAEIVCLRDRVKAPPLRRIPDMRRSKAVSAK